ncbi:hypothetical protein [Variovorax soli]|uniref:TubC N-terminal docking domain-containing protein n=1 Tax=Variovorax soli TaxID=376815 RepID=A0ABU1NES8_9BURK|nr:hypothetical protein [Variovorax soli]MDR6536969.1 hypothetical protein [Variovorax soli]
MAPAHHIADLLRAAGLAVELTSDRALKVAPASKLTPDLRELIRASKATLIDWLTAIDEPAPDPDRWCWPHTTAMNTAEIDLLVSRVDLFVRRGTNVIDATTLADTLVIRDRDADNRRACLECSNLSGPRCSAWRRAGIGGPMVSESLTAILQRCPGFSSVEGL